LSRELETVSPVWSGVWAMSFCAFVLIASEFLPVSLLTPLATDLSITEGRAGQSISISGLFAVITSLFLTSFIGQIDRRNILLFFTALMAISGVIVAFAPNAIVLMIGRALLGACVGGFWSMAAATIMRLVPKKSVPKALTILNGGNALATTVAAPLGAFLGGIIGWRGAFFCVVPLAIFVLIWQRISVPHLPVRGAQRKNRANIRTVIGLLGQCKVAWGTIAILFLFMGQFTLFTYIRPFLETVTGVTTKQLSFVLLAMGVFGVIGTFIVEKFLGNFLFPVLIATPLLMMVTALAFILFGSSLPVIFVLVAAWGFLGTSAPVGWWTWLSRTLPNDAESGGGLIVAIIQLAIMFGASLGGYVFDLFGYQSTFGLSASLLGMSGFTAYIAWKYKDIN